MRSRRSRPGTPGPVVRNTSNDGAKPTDPRVLQLITDRDRRGAQVFALDLQSGLEEIGFRATTIALRQGQHGDLLPLEVLGSSPRSWRTLRSLRSHVREFDVVIAHGSSTLFACSLALAFTGVPFVYRQISDPLYWAATWRRRIRVAAMIRRAAAIVALSDGTSQVLTRHYWLKPDRSCVIPNAVPVGNFRPANASDRERARERFGLPTTPLVVAYVGALAEEKGVELVVRCIASVPPASALIVGDGPDRQRLEQLAAEGAPGRVFFAGAIDDSQDAFAAADLVVLPSRGGDSMPAVLIEAGLCGLATVVTPVGAITDVVVDGVSGVVVPIDDLTAFTSAVSDLLDDHDRRNKLGSAAAAHCRENFTIEATAPQWAQLLRSVAQRTNRGSARSRFPATEKGGQ
jgi:glycosyltransferase involved in cell wall biosynthesis